MSPIFAVVLFGHGVAHLVGFAGPWRLMDVEGITFHRALFDGRLAVDDRTLRALGLVWLALAAGFAATALGAALHASWWSGAASALAVASLLTCLAAWPAARIGAAVDVALLGALQLARA